jgi:hypothetical protein
MPWRHFPRCSSAELPAHVARSRPALLSEAVELAGEQAALFWQLRAAVSLARLKVRQHRAIEARTILAPICEAFVDEPEFSDLGTARNLLNSLPAGPAG